MNESKELSKSRIYTDYDFSKRLSFSDLSYVPDKCYLEDGSSILSELLPFIKDYQFHYFSKKCHNFPSIEFIDDENVLYSCAKHEQEKIPIEDFFDPNNKFYFYKDNNESNNNNFNNKEKLYKLRCYKHKKIKGYKYKYYCLNCQKNICGECCPNHLGDNHNLFIFDSKKQSTIKKIKEISYILGKNKKNPEISFEKNFSLTSSYNEFIIKNIEQNKCEIISKKNKDNFLKLIDIIISDFNNYPNFSHFFNIENIYNFLKKKIKSTLCKIKSEYIDNTGLFCNIDIEKPYHPSNKCTYLIIIRKKNEKNYFLKDQEIQILIEDREILNLKIDSKSNIYYNEYIILIEIRKKDQLYNINYLEIEEDNNEKIMIITILFFYIIIKVK